MLTNFEIEFNALNLFEFLFILDHSAADKAMFMQFFLNSILAVDESVDSLTDF